MINPPVEKTMQIPLSKERFAIVDAEDYPYLSQWEWHITTSGYAARKASRDKRVYMHRVVSNTPDGLFADHINGNPLDNRRTNLRNATHLQNVRNRQKFENSSNTSLFKGVSWHKRNSMWQARIKVDRKERFLGYFHIETEAAEAYNKAALLHFGEFAKLNSLEN